MTLVNNQSCCCIVKIHKLGINEKIASSQGTRGCYSRHGRAPRQKQAPVASRKAPDPVRVGQGRLYKEAQSTGNHRRALLGGEGLLLKAWPGSEAKASPRHLQQSARAYLCRRGSP